MMPRSPKIRQLLKYRQLLSSPEFVLQETTNGPIIADVCRRVVDGSNQNRKNSNGEDDHACKEHRTK